MKGTTADESPGELRRPYLTDAPEWFNRARARSNRSQVFHPRVYRPRPVPRPGASSTIALPRERWWRRNQKKLIRALPLFALPVVFAMGFWSRGTATPAARETATGNNAAPAVV